MFPGAVEDVRDVIRWVVGGGMADTELGMNVDFERITVSGSSAGGNLALAGCLLENGDGHGSTQEDDEREEERERTDIARKIRGIVTFYAAVSDQRLQSLVLFSHLFSLSLLMMIDVPL